MKWFVFHLFLMFSVVGFSQFENAENEEVINLDPVWVFSKEPQFDTQEAWKNYQILKYRVKKVYPYAKLAAEELRVIRKTLETLEGRYDKKQYIKKKQQQTEERFTEELKKLSRSQGRILIKLIHRQTGDTAYNLVKELRSGWRAFWYNNTAWLYDLSLKATFNPMEVKEDFWIEEILLRAFANGDLDFQPSAKKIDYQKLEDKWKISLDTSE